MKSIPTTWNLTALGKSYKDTSFKNDRILAEKKAKAFARKWKKSGEYLKNDLSLKKALDQFNDLQKIGNKEMLFLWLSLQVDSSNTMLQASMKKFDEYINELSDHTRFFLLELGKIDSKQQKKFLRSTQLREYRHYLETIFTSSKYMLSEKEERIISFKSGVAHENWASMLEEFLYQEKRMVYIQKEVKGKMKIVQEKCGLATLSSLVSSPVKKVRSSARLALIDIIKQYAPVAEKEINSILENKKNDDLLRGFSRPDSSRHTNEDIDTRVVDTLRKVVQENNSVSHQFYALKAKLLKQNSFLYSERALNYGKLEKKFSYAEAIEIVKRAFGRIDDSFVKVFEDFIKEGRIDVYPKESKRGGAFCMSHGVDDPVYVMLNYTHSMRDIGTLAHEMGHAIHAIFAKKEKQLNYYPPMCTAEVASTFCEDFVFDELLDSVSEDERLVMMMGKLQDKIQTIFRQIAAYNFEFELHTEFRKAGYLSQAEIGKLFNKHMKSYLGKSFIFDEDSSIEWIPWSHFRRPFYVYSYAMGLLCAQAMQSAFKKNPEFISSIHDFYSTGSSLSPVDIFKKMGMDITKPAFWQQGIDEIKDLLKETKKLAKKLGKI